MWSDEISPEYYGWWPIIFAVAEGDITRSIWIRRNISQLKLVWWYRMLVRRSNAIRDDYKGKIEFKGTGGLAERIAQMTGWEIKREKKAN